MERSLKVQEELGTIGAKVQESLAGIHVVKAYTLEEHEAGAFRESTTPTTSRVSRWHARAAGCCR